MNVMPVGVLKKLGKSQKDLKKTNMKMTNFTGESTDALGFYIVELTVGTKTSSTVFLSWMPTRDTLYCQEEIGFTPIYASHLPCINS